MKEPNRERKNEIKAINSIALNEEQKYVKRLIIENQIVIVTGRAGSGKSLVCANAALDLLKKKQINNISVTRAAIEVGRSLGFLPGPQPLWSKVLTPTGWSNIGDVQIGDKVVGKQGISTVKDKSEIGYEDIYKVTTSDNRETHCSINHLFYTTTFYNKKQGKEGSVKSLKEIIDTFYDIHGKYNHYLPYNNPVEFNNIKTHIISPYVLGCLLGDGCFSGSITISSSDIEITNKIQKLVDFLDISLNKSGINYSFSYMNEHIGTKPSKPIKITNVKTNESKIYYKKYEVLQEYDINPGTLDNRCKNQSIIDGLKFEFLELNSKSVNPIKNEIFNLGLLDKRAHNKFIPKEYIYNSSVDDRIELLRGLMDTDGSNNHTCATFTTVSKQLRDDIIELVRSLGGKATYVTLDKRGQISIGGNKAQCNYISYEVWINMDINPFYLTRKAIKYKPKFKHEIKITNIEKLDKDYIQCLLLDSEDGLYITDDYILTHNSLGEKYDPYIEALVENLNKCCTDKSEVSRLLDTEKIKALPIQFIRGKTVDDLLILEESQNTTKGEMLAILTRLGKNGKIIINGDNEQTDIKTSDGQVNGLTYVIELSKKIEEIKWVKLKENHRSDLVGKILSYEYGN